MNIQALRKRDNKVMMRKFEVEDFEKLGVYYRNI